MELADLKVLKVGSSISGAVLFAELLGKQCSRSPSLPAYGFWVDWKQSKHARKKKKKHFFGAWKLVFLCFSAKPLFIPYDNIWGHVKKMNRKGELQTSRISSNLRIWQFYYRVPQILKVLCVRYTWKYVARLGFESLNFLYSEFLYNTQAVYIYTDWLIDWLIDWLVDWLDIFHNREFPSTNPLFLRCSNMNSALLPPWPSGVGCCLYNWCCNKKCGFIRMRLANIATRLRDQLLTNNQARTTDGSWV